VITEYSLKSNKYTKTITCRLYAGQHCLHSRTMSCPHHTELVYRHKHVPFSQQASCPPFPFAFLFQPPHPLGMGQDLSHPLSISSLHSSRSTSISQSAPSLLSTCPNNPNLSFFITKLTGLNPNSSLSSILLFLSFNITVHKINCECKYLYLYHLGWTCYGPTLRPPVGPMCNQILTQKLLKSLTGFRKP